MASARLPAMEVGSRALGGFGLGSVISPEREVDAADAMHAPEGPMPHDGNSIGARAPPAPGALSPRAPEVHVARDIDIDIDIDIASADTSHAGASHAGAGSGDRESGEAERTGSPTKAVGNTVNFSPIRKQLLNSNVDDSSVPLAGNRVGDTVKNLEHGPESSLMSETVATGAGETSSSSQPMSASAADPDPGSGSGAGAGADGRTALIPGGHGLGLHLEPEISYVGGSVGLESDEADDAIEAMLLIARDQTE